MKFSAQCLINRGTLQILQRMSALVQLLIKEGRRQWGSSTRLMLFNAAAWSVPSWHSWNGVVLTHYCVSLASVCYPQLHGMPLAGTPSPVERQRINQTQNWLCQQCFVRFSGNKDPSLICIVKLSKIKACHSPVFHIINVCNKYYFGI